MRRRSSSACGAPACACCCSPRTSPNAGTAPLRALEPTAVVLCGAEPRLDVLGEPLRRALRAGGAHAFAYRAARLVGGRDGMPQLGTRPSEAAQRLLGALATA